MRKSLMTAALVGMLSIGGSAYASDLSDFIKAEAGKYASTNVKEKTAPDGKRVYTTYSIKVQPPGGFETVLLKFRDYDSPKLHDEVWAYAYANTGSGYSASIFKCKDGDDLPEEVYKGTGPTLVDADKAAAQPSAKRAVSDDDTALWTALIQPVLQAAKSNPGG